MLVSDEFIRGSYYTKFPGGGLEFGEGTRDCLKREFMEEMNLNVLVGDHIYTTDYFQMSAFKSRTPDHLYILLRTGIRTYYGSLRQKPFDFDEQQLAVYKDRGETETFRFINWDDFSEESVTLPIDKIVAKMLKSK